MDQNNKGFSIVEIFLFLIVITIVAMIGYRCVSINSATASKSFTIGEQFTLSINETAETFYDGDKILLTLTNVSRSECPDEDYYVAGIKACSPSENSSYSLSVNGDSESYTSYRSHSYMNGERQGYGVITMDFELNKSATFVVDTLLNSCDLLLELSDDKQVGKVSYNRCVYSSAYSQKMFEWCKLLSVDNYPSQSYCQEGVATLLNDKDLCKSIDDPNGYCIVDDVIQSGNIKACYELQGDYKSRCIQKVAQKDPSKCDDAPQERGPYVDEACRALLEPDAVQY